MQVERDRLPLESHIVGSGIDLADEDAVRGVEELRPGEFLGGRRGELDELEVAEGEDAEFALPGWQPDVAPDLASALIEDEVVVVLGREDGDLGGEALEDAPEDGLGIDEVDGITREALDEALVEE
ncbi:MAG TPA: hypothetical protein QGF05_08340 [Dehalococcoidia bacterium]|nr:hypothetical protein [Dehalococcoidia bacterium]